MTLRLDPPDEALQEEVPPDGIDVLPDPDADYVECRLGSGAGGVDIVLDLPRIWWRLDDGRTELGPWRDTPLELTREEFECHADAGASMSVLPRRQLSIRAGFGDDVSRPYERKKEEDCIAIPLLHFVDYAEIDGRLTSEAQFCVEWVGQTLTVIRVPAEPVPQILSFTSDRTEVKAGQKAVLSWETRDVDGVRVRIDPAIGSVKPIGTARVELAASAKFTLRLTDSGIEIAKEEVFVMVHQEDSGPMTPEKLLDKVVNMQNRDLLEYYHGFLARDISKSANQLRNVTQYFEQKGIIYLFQERVTSEIFQYLAVRSSKEITQQCIDDARVLHVDRKS